MQPKTYSYLRANFDNGLWVNQGYSQAKFHDEVLAVDYPAPNGGVNLERMQLNPLLTHDDDFSFAILGTDLAPSGKVDDRPRPTGSTSPTSTTSKGAGTPWIRPHSSIAGTATDSSATQGRVRLRPGTWPGR